MSKYIDAEKLISEILKLRSESCISESDDYYENAKREIIDIIESLHQELESSNGKFVFPNFLYARTVNNKTIDVSYVPQSLDAVEYIKNGLTEQPDVDLEKEIDRFEDWMETYNQADYPTSFTTRDIARHFAQWGAEHLKD